MLVFNKLIEGTAPQLRQELSNAVTPVFTDYLSETLDRLGLGTADELQRRFREQTRAVMDVRRKTLIDAHGDRGRVPGAVRHDDLRRFRDRPLTDPYEEILTRRSQQPLFLLRFALAGAGGDDAAIAAWTERELVGPLCESLDRIVTHYLAEDAPTGADEDERLELAERELVIRLEDYRSVDLVGRYDGSNSRDREVHRRNFNDYYNPFVLLVSQVGEEGIDLQKQCRYVIHYDLEWNPARMEQREGRVDRMGWGRAGEQFIDVRFLLLKGTYEERIFHTVMQRDQWFSILIGSKRKELGEIKEGDGAEQDSEVVEEVAERGRLTPAEKQSVLFDLRPTPVARV